MKKKIFHFVTIVALLCGCAENPSEELDENFALKIHGSVVANGEPVNAAAILLTPGGGVKITGSDGMYDFSDLEPGKYEMKVFKEGFLSFNQSIDISDGKDKEVVVTLTKGTGKLSINKAYIDMGSNESNNATGFSIINTGDVDLEWQIVNAAQWITNIEPQTGTAKAGGAEAVSFKINRSRLSSNTTDNYATLVLRSTTAGDGSTSELLITVFGNGNGTNVGNDNSDVDYIIIGDLYVQTKDLGKNLDWSSANSLCNNSIVGDYDDWRLPTIDELATIYTKKEAIGGFEDTRYWSSSLESSYYYVMEFSNGRQSRTSDWSNVRAVRKDIAISDPNYVVLSTAGIMVQKTDIGTGNWNSMNSLCENSIMAGYTDWRMPTKDELAVLYNERSTIGGFTTSGSNTRYWSSTANEGYYWYQDFSSGAQNNNGNASSVNRCRCVRDLP